MDKQISTLDFKIAIEHEVIGQGPMIYSQQQVGDWWIMLAEDYQGKVPPEVQKELFKLLNQGVEIEGLLVAEDMRVIEARREQKVKKAEATEKATKAAGQALLLPLIGLGLGLAFVLSALTSFDPMLIAVTKDGRWICLGEWFD